MRNLEAQAAGNAPPRAHRLGLRRRRAHRVWLASRIAIFSVAALALLAGLAASAPAATPTLTDTAYVTDGFVNAVTQSSGTLYIGGNFTQVGPRTGGFSAIDSSTGSPDLSYPEVAGEVDAVASDGSGG